MPRSYLERASGGGQGGLVAVTISATGGGRHQHKLAAQRCNNRTLGLLACACVYLRTNRPPRTCFVSVRARKSKMVGGRGRRKVYAYRRLNYDAGWVRSWMLALFIFGLIFLKGCRLLDGLGRTKACYEMCRVLITKTL